MVDHLRSKLTPSVVSQFEREGYVVIDNGVPDTVARQYLDEIRKSKKNGLMQPNKVQFLTGQGPIEVTKPHVFEADMHQQHVRRALPAFEELFDAGVTRVVDAMNETWPALQLTRGETPQEQAKTFTIKAQVNEGGCFPWHYDNPAKPNKRRLTFALYLCDGWSPECGGELVVMPFLRPQVVIPPRFNRLVLFRADMVVHRVLPCRLGYTRYCFTIWLDSETTNLDEEVNLRAKHLTLDSLPLLQGTPLQRALSRAVYSEEYVRSAVECFGEGSREAKISNMIHEAHVKPLKASTAVAAFVEKLRSVRPDGDCDDARARRESV